MIAVVDYGMGNLGSVMNACRYLRLPAELVTRPGQLAAARAVILPGVGAFGDCLEDLRRRGMAQAVRDWINDGRPYLGICLGLQILCTGSEESPQTPGLGLIPATVKRFPAESGLKVPHMGWNRISVREPGCPLLEGIRDGEYFYFVHSYYVPETGEGVAAVSEYGVGFCAVYHQGNVFAVQFHPERSHRAGLQVLSNFARVVREAG